MAHLVSLSAFAGEQPGGEGAARIDFPSAGSRGPRWTQVQKITALKDVYREPPDPGGVRFFYVLQGEGTLSLGETQARVRGGSSLFFKEEEAFSLARSSDGPLVFLRFRVKSEAGAPEPDK